MCVARLATRMRYRRCALLLVIVHVCCGTRHGSFAVLLKSCKSYSTTRLPALMQAWGRQLGDLLLMATDHAEPETLRALGLRDEQVVVVPDLLARADSSEDRFERLEGRGLLTAADADCGRVPYRQLEECFTACSALPSCVAFVDNYQAQPPFCRCTTRVGTMSDMPGEMTIYLKESAFDRVELHGPLPPREQPHVPEWRGGPAVAEPHELPSLTRRTAGLLQAGHRRLRHRVDWYVVLDDDTFLRVDVLRGLLAQLDPGRPLMIGSPVDSSPFLRPADIEVHGMSRHCGGGSAWVMSRALMDTLVPRLDSCLEARHTRRWWYHDEVEIGRARAAWAQRTVQAVEVPVRYHPRDRLT